MPVRLNITIDEDVYDRLKRDCPPKGISRFINETLRTRLRPSDAELKAGYVAAAKDSARRRLAAEWDTLETVEEWPEW